MKKERRKGGGKIRVMIEGSELDGNGVSVMIEWSLNGEMGGAKVGSP